MEVREVAHREGAALAGELEAWYHAYLDLWRCVSKESTVAHTLKLVCDYADVLRGRTQKA